MSYASLPGKTKYRHTVHWHNCVIIHVAMQTEFTGFTLYLIYTHLYSYRGKGEVHRSSSHVRNILSHLYQSDQNPPCTGWCILSHSCIPLKGPGIAWWHWKGSSGCCTVPLEDEKKHPSVREALQFCASPENVVFLGTHLYTQVEARSTLQRPDRRVWPLPSDSSLPGRWSYTASQRRKAPKCPHKSCCP